MLPKYFNVDSAAKCETVAIALSLQQIPKDGLKLKDSEQDFFTVMILSTDYLRKKYISEGLSANNWDSILQGYRKKIRQSPSAEDINDCMGRLGSVVKSMKMN